MSRVEVCDWTGRETRIPETGVERVAYAMAIHDARSREGHLNDDELAGLRIVYDRLARYGNDWPSVGAFLGCDAFAAKRCVRSLMGLVRVELQRRSEVVLPPLAQARLARAFWPDFMPLAEAAWSIMIEHPEAGL